MTTKKPTDKATKLTIKYGLSKTKIQPPITADELIYGYPERPGVRRPTLTGTRVG